MQQPSDRNVFILGAGFSADAGAPLIHDFLDVSRELFDDPDSGLDDTEKQEFEKVFAFKKRVAQSREKFRIDLDNIEQMFGLVEMSHRLNKELEDTRDATVYLIAKTLELAIARRTGRPRLGFRLVPGYGRQDPSFLSKVTREASGTDQFHSEIYRHFALLLGGDFDDPLKKRSRSNTVITFNYDLVLDHALLESGKRPFYGLEDDPVVSSEFDTIQLLKLHGSTNWGICRSCKRVLILNEKVTTFPNDFRARPCEGCSRPHLRPFLVPPSWDKSDYQDVMRPVWEKAVKAIQQATRICVIGYSMPESDAFFKFLLALGLAENHQLYKFILVDKVSDEGTSESVERRYTKIFENIFVERRFKFYRHGFATFLTQGNSVLNRAEAIVPLGVG